MGGFGSGRIARRARQVAEHLKSLDVNRLNRAGCLGEGYAGGWEWRRDGETIGSIGMKMQAGCLILDYRIRRGEGEWRTIRQVTLIERTPCRYGGTRPWFTCPGFPGRPPCGQRAARLFGAGDYFLCRRCYSVVYASQSDDSLGRAQRRARKLSRRLQPRIEADGTSRRRRMWRATRERLVERSVAAELEADDLLEAAMHRIFNRLERRSAVLSDRRGFR